MSFNGGNRRFPAGPAENFENKSYRSRDNRANRNSSGSRYQERQSSRYGGGTSYRNGGGGRFRSDARYDNRNFGSTGSNVGINSANDWNTANVNWSMVVPLGERKRLRPTLWDRPPKGFENVPAERAKLSGLFPLPGQPQDLDHSKLDGIVSSGVLTRRTRILFEDPTRVNMSKTKYNQILILTSVGSGKTEMERAQNYIKDFVSLVGEVHNVKDARFLQDNRLLLHFSSEEITTIVLSCQKYIEAKTGSKFIWQRPGECVRKAEHEEAICEGQVVALLDLGPTDEESLKNSLAEDGIEVNWLKLITVGPSQEFTGTALIDPITWKIENSKYKWIRPNDSKLHQTFTELTFQQLPQLVAQQDRGPSKVIMLLNCVDGKDLKNEDFVKELYDCMTKSSMMSSFGEIESVKIPKPGADYRTSFETIQEGIGKIFVKFQNVDSARTAMQKLPGSQFNDRTVICSYFSERDYNMDIL
ncbi:LADA_0D09340g1_1 [Lachancea dasiensis]|uniref:LADA_0D09340g1_1 n=1 Tax=Lachancea dasiensis TaxID=1072105 RepID=A0A1G4J788_9SACH|nr:LADA_0D09340g1_1 [Lachancea dasiensis]